MQHPDLEQALKDLKSKKRATIVEFTRKTIDAINLSEEATLTHLSITDSKCDALCRTKKFEKSRILDEEVPVEASVDSSAEDAA
tara:strand:- start:414 stop:665 length:252 start_codon:yes stop_codon:yes gene_type:complete